MARESAPRCAAAAVWMFTLRAGGLSVGDAAYPELGDYGHLTVRRPAGVVRVQKWKTVRLGGEGRSGLKNHASSLDPSRALCSNGLQTKYPDHTAGASL